MYIDVYVNIAGILLFGDESSSDYEIDNGYKDVMVKQIV
jgi:hypothetical protein